MEKLKKPFLFVNQSEGKCLICNKDKSANDKWWKTLTNLTKTWSSVVLPIDHQYYEVHEVIGDRKQPSVSNIARRVVVRLLGDTLLINKLKKERIMKLISLARKLQPYRRRFHRMQLCWARDPVQLEQPVQALIMQICFVCNEIRPYDSTTNNKGGYGAFECKSVGDRLKDAGQWAKQMIST